MGGRQIECGVKLKRLRFAVMHRGVFLINTEKCKISGGQKTTVFSGDLDIYQAETSSTVADLGRSQDGAICLVKEGVKS